MTIRLLEGIQLAGIHQAIGSILTLDPDDEAGHVSSNKAVYTTLPDIGDDGVPVLATKNFTGRIKTYGTAQSDIPMPFILFIGDSTFAYAHSISGAPTAAFGNSDGTVTVQFASAMGFQVGDRIGFAEANGNAWKFTATESKVSAVTGTGPYFYTFTPDETPTVGTHPTPANLAIVYLDRLSAAGLPSEIMAVLGAGFGYVIAGNGGDDIYNIEARLPYLLNRFKPTNVILSHGINDCYRTSRTVAEVVARYPSFLETVQKAGASLEIIGPPPQPSTRPAWTTTTRDWMRDFREAQAIYCGAAQIDYTDWWSCAAGTLQAVNPTDSNAASSANVIGADLVHPALAGNYLAAKRIASKYRSRYPTARPPFASSVIDGGIFVNPLMSGTAGTRTNGTGTVSSGNVADSMDVTVIAGTATVTPYQTARTVAADGDVCGNWQGATVVAVAAGDTVQIRTAALHALVANGQNYRLIAEIKLKTGPELCRELSFTMNSQTATTGNKSYNARAVTSQSQTPHPEGAKWVIDTIIGVRGPVGTHGAPTAFRPAFQCVAAGAGTIEFEVSKLSIKPV